MRLGSKFTCNLACIADKEQVEKFLLIEPPAMIPTLSPVHDLQMLIYRNFIRKNIFQTYIELNLHHHGLPQSCVLSRGRECSPLCQCQHQPEMKIFDIFFHDDLNPV